MRKQPPSLAILHCSRLVDLPRVSIQARGMREPRCRGARDVRRQCMLEPTTPALHVTSSGSWRGSSLRRVLLLMCEHRLLAPTRAGRAHGPAAHDGRIVVDKPDTMWGIDGESRGRRSQTLFCARRRFPTRAARSCCRAISRAERRCRRRRSRGQDGTWRVVTLLWLRTYRNAEDLRCPLQDFRRRYNE